MCLYFLFFFFIILFGCLDKRGLINYMIDRAIRHRRGRLINTYLISRLVQFITSMTTRVLCFFFGSINPVGAPRRWLKPTLRVVIWREHYVAFSLFVRIWKLGVSLIFFFSSIILIHYTIDETYRGNIILTIYYNTALLCKI